jgi:AcrR family transcriptional regulator
MSERTRAAVIAETRRLLTRRVYSEVTLAEIAAACGVTKGALYHHWATKEELLAAVQEDSYDTMITRSREIAERQLDPVDELRQLTALHVAMVLAHRAALPVSIPYRFDDTTEARLQAKRDRIEAFVVDVIERGSRTGVFAADAEPKLSAYVVLGACYWAARWYRPDGEWSVATIAERIFTMALSGLTGEGGPSRRAR